MNIRKLGRVIVSIVLSSVMVVLQPATDIYAAGAQDRGEEEIVVVEGYEGTDEPSSIEIEEEPVHTDRDGIDVGLNRSFAQMYAGDKLVLELSGVPAKQVVWKTSDKKIANVSKGVVTAASEGNAVITATDKISKKDYTCSVKVERIDPDIHLNTDDIVIMAGETAELWLEGADAKKVSWSVSDKKLAQIKKLQGKIRVISKGAGEVTVTAVYKPVSKIQTRYTCRITMEPVRGELSAGEVMVKKGKKHTLTFTGGYGKTTWRSANPKIAAVSGKGVITGKSDGNTVITATNCGIDYTCEVYVGTTKTLGKQTIDPAKTDNEEVKVGDVEMTFLPGTIEKKTTVTVSQVNGLDGAEGFEGVKSFDFSMKGSTLEQGKNLVMVEYPLEVPDGCVPVAAYFNETTGMYEPVLSEYDPDTGKITVFIDHFSTYVTGYRDIFTGTDMSILFENTTEAELCSYYSLPNPGKKADDEMDIVVDALQSKTPTDTCMKDGLKALREMDPVMFSNLPDAESWTYGMDIGSNLWASLGLTDSYSTFLSNAGNQIAAVGFVVNYVDALRQMYKGNKQDAAFSGTWAAVGLGQAVAAGWLGSTADVAAAASAGCASVAFVGLAIGKLKSQLDSDNEKAWYKVYNLYYTDGDGKRNQEYWNDLVQVAFEDGNITAGRSAIEWDVNEYVNKFFDLDYEEVVSRFGEANFEKRFGMSWWVFKDSYGKVDQEKIKNEKKTQLYNNEIKKAFEWFYAKRMKEAGENTLEAANALVKPLNRTVAIEFYDENAGENGSAYEGYTVRWKETAIPSNIRDKNNMSVVLDRNGKGTVKFSLWAYLHYGFKSEVELLDKDKNPVGEGISFTFSGKKDVKNRVSISQEVMSVEPELTVAEGQKAVLEIKGLIDQSKAVCVSSDDAQKYISIKGPAEEGLEVCGISEGTANIDITYGKQKAKCKVTVTASEKGFSDPAITLEVDEQKTVYLELVTPDGQKSKIKPETITVPSGGDCVELTQTEDGGVMIKGKNIGTATISATYLGKTYTCVVTVQMEGVALSKSAVTLAVGEDTDISLQSDKAGVKTVLKYDSVTATEGSKFITFTKNGDNTVNIKGKSAGEAVVTFKYRGVEFRCRITVTKEPEESSVAISTSQLALKVGETSGTIYLVETTGGTSKYVKPQNVGLGGDKSLVQLIATNDGGIKVKALAAGVVRVALLYSGIAYYCDVTITADEDDGELFLSETDIHLKKIGDSTKIYLYKKDASGNKVAQSFMYCYLDSGDRVFEPRKDNEDRGLIITAQEEGTGRYYIEKGSEKYYFTVTVGDEDSVIDLGKKKAYAYQDEKNRFYINVPGISETEFDNIEWKAVDSSGDSQFIGHPSDGSNKIYFEFYGKDETYTFNAKIGEKQYKMTLETAKTTYRDLGRTYYSIIEVSTGTWRLNNDMGWTDLGTLQINDCVYEDSSGKKSWIQTHFTGTVEGNDIPVSGYITNGSRTYEGLYSPYVSHEYDDYEDTFDCRIFVDGLAYKLTVKFGTSTDMRQVARYTLKVNGITGEHEFESEYSDN
ncbi:MAG: Ig-like domain-containing protein [Lachnospiraceae bacterium]|nr:Ig-like domain-containing protein [Lachnospiraceae bacterium]